MPSSVPFSLIVPEEMDGREGTVSDFAARCSGIIMEAIKWAPETTRSLLQVGGVNQFGGVNCTFTEKIIFLLWNHNDKKITDSK